MVIVLPALLGLSMLAAGCSDDDERRGSSGSTAAIRLGQPRTMALPRAPVGRRPVVDISRADPPDERAPRARRAQPGVAPPTDSDRAAAASQPVSPASQPVSPTSQPVSPTNQATRQTTHPAGTRDLSASPRRRKREREPRWVPERHVPAW